MSILPVLKVKMESRCNLLTTILYDSFLSFSMMVKDIGPVRVLRRLKVLSKRLRDSILSPIFHSYIFAMYKNESLWI